MEQKCKELGLECEHHSFPCTATMVSNPETKEPILHIDDFTIREEVEKALEKVRNKGQRYS